MEPASVRSPVVNGTDGQTFSPLSRVPEVVPQDSEEQDFKNLHRPTARAVRIARNVLFLVARDIQSELTVAFW